MKPRLLDLCCKAGAASKGYALAGWEVVGVDIDPQPRYPFEFMQRDMREIDPQWIASNFDGAHASPPCQFATALRHAPNGKPHENLIPAARKLLDATGLPYIIENVEGARPHMLWPTLLCGSMFGLSAKGYQLRRHRLFESNMLIEAPGPCKHTSPVIGVYGGHARCRAARHGGRGTRDFVGQDKPALAKEAMGMDWGTMAELSEAIPPAYTEFLGRQLMTAASV